MGFLRLSAISALAILALPGLSATQSTPAVDPEFAAANSALNTCYESAMASFASVDPDAAAPTVIRACALQRLAFAAAGETWLARSGLDEATKAGLTDYLAMTGQALETESIVAGMIRSVRRPDAPIGQRFAVAETMTVRDPDGWGRIHYIVRLSGRRGDRFRIETSASARYGPTHDGTGNDRYRASYVGSASLDDLQKTLDVELLVDGKVDVDLNQIGRNLETATLIPFVPYTILITKLN